MHRKLLKISWIFVTALVASPTFAKTWIIDPSGGKCPNIQAGVDSATTGDSLVLVSGTYSGPDNRDVNLGGMDIVITSQSGPGSTIIDCQGLGRAFVVNQGETRAAEISGFTIMNGQAGDGGAIFIDTASPTIRNIIFTGNDGTRGGALYIKDGSPVVENNEFVANNAQQNGGAMFFDKSGVSDVTNNLITGNDAFSGGGGIYCSLHAPNIVGNIIANNSSASGGGIYLIISDAYVDRNTVVENTAGTGAGILVSSAAPYITKTIVAFNYDGPGVSCFSTPSPTFDCSAFFGNAGGDAVCGIDAGTNVSTDPQFCGNVGTGNYYLQSDSPCEPNSNSCLVQIGALGIQCGSVATKPMTWGHIKKRFDSE